MKAIILAGGFAKRLWPMTKENAKPLIDVGGEPVINHVVREMQKLKKKGVIDQIFVSTNKKFEQDFIKWLENYGFDIKLVIEESMHEKEKLGAIGGINFVLAKEKIDDDCIIIAGDNLFGFDLDDFFAFYEEKKSPIVAFFYVKDIEKEKL